jgi:hypothetical protein
MSLLSLQNHKGFFSEYWLGTILSARGSMTQRVGAATARRLLERLTRVVDSIGSKTDIELAHFRERFARPVLEELFGFELKENAAEPRLRTLGIRNGNGGSPLAMALLCPDWSDADERQQRKHLEDGLLGEGLDYGVMISPEVLRLIRRPGLGMRGASFDLRLGSVVENQDIESLSAAFRVLAADCFVRNENGSRPIDVLEEESRKHSARVSSDLKQAVFDSAELIVAGLLDDVRTRPDTFTSCPTIAEIRDTGFLALYRLLFILYAEARDERLIGHPLYQRSYSLDQLVSRLVSSPRDSLAANRFGLWMQLQAVFRIFNEGITSTLPGMENIPPRGGRLFDETTEDGRRLRSLRLNDRQTAAILLALATTRPRRGIGRERVSFRELEIEQLGSVYEGLLEYEPAEAGSVLIEVEAAGRELALTAEQVVRLCHQKSLQLRGDQAIVAGTEAAQLHVEHIADAEGDSIDDHISVDDEADSDEGSDDDGDGEIARGAPLKLLRRIELGEFFFKPGSARKSSGSYYTPTPMVDFLVRESLAPLVNGRSVAEIERLRVIDLACGSGHFLVGAARFLGKHLFEQYRREARDQPPAKFHPDRALTSEVRLRWEREGLDWCKRRIVERCLFGVDLNPAAVQLAQVALWIESLAGDRPLSFFEHHIRNGNSLFGSWLDRYDSPPHPGLSNKSDKRTLGLFESELKKHLVDALAERRLIDAPLPPEVRGDTPQEYEYKQDRLRRAELATSQARLLLDLRSASVFIVDIWRDFPMLMSSFDLKTEASVRPWWAEFEQIRARECFFHWELEFPEVFLETDRPGFDAVLGNPPWDKVLPTKQEFYSRVDVLVRALKGNDLDQRIRELHAEHNGLEAEFTAYRDRATTMAKQLRSGGDFPLAEARSQAAHEDLSKYFVDRALRLVAKGGAAGLVVPSVLYSGDGWVGIRRYLLDEVSIQRFYGFENRQKIFPIHSLYKFVNMVVRKAPAAGRFTAAFMRHDVLELESAAPKSWEVELTRDEITTQSPDTLTFLEYRSARDQEIIRKMYAGRPTLGGDGPGNWGTRLMSWRAHEAIFNSADDKDLFTDPRKKKLYTPKGVLGSEPEYMDEIIERMRAKGFWPVYEGKNIDQFLVGVKPFRWWLSVEQAVKKYNREPRSEPTLVFRDVASNTNERTCIAAALPAGSAAAHSLAGMTAKNVDAESAAVVFNSLCFDFALRLRIAGTHVSFTYIQPMPVPSADVVRLLPKMSTRAAWGTALDHVTEDRSLWPALWETNRAVAGAYGLDAADFAHILAAFPVFARKRLEFHKFLTGKVAVWANL